MERQRGKNFLSLRRSFSASLRLSFALSLFLPLPASPFPALPALHSWFILAGFETEKEVTLFTTR